VHRGKGWVRGPMSNGAGPVTLLFTDLVSAAELVQQAGDERAQRSLRAHHRLLKHVAAAHGAREVRWLGDGLLSVFPSTADAVRCAVAIQQAARRRAASGRLSIRVGVHVGEALHDETDYFGVPVLIARRLCARARGGQILCSGLVAGLLAGQNGVTFRECDAFELPGLAAPLATSEVVYRHDEPTALLAHPPFVGRAAERTKFTRKLQDAREGQGGLVLVAGEPGIGKTRLTEEFAESASEFGAVVLAGRCYEGEWAPPYGPFAEAIAGYTRVAEPDQLRQDLGAGAPSIARVVAAVRERLPAIPEAAPLQPDEERVRLLDAVSQFLIAIAARTPVVVIIDDLHWADKDSIAMLRHVARSAPCHRLLLVGAYRDVEVDRAHPLSEALGALPRETRYQHLPLKGLERAEVAELLETVADQEVPEALVSTISTETSGNPFFIREVLLHLVEEGTIFRREGRWTSNLAITEIGIPEGVKQVVGRRIGRLSAAAQSLLSVAAAFTGGFRLAIAGRVAGLDEAAALDGLDDALVAQVVCVSAPETYDFTHALIRHTLYAALSPARQVRLHRQIAETMEEMYGDPSASSGQAPSTGSGSAEHAAEIAEHYHRSAALPGAERGVAHCLNAAEHAERAAAFHEAATYLRMALELLPAGDARRARLLARLGLALAWSREAEAAVQIATEAADLLAATEGDAAAADYLAAATSALWFGTFSPLAWRLAEEGLRYIGSRRDLTWAQLTLSDVIRREVADPQYPGIVLDSPERRAAIDIVFDCFPTLSRNDRMAVTDIAARSRAEVLERQGDEAFSMGFYAGDYVQAIALAREACRALEAQGRFGLLALELSWMASWEGALGDLEASRDTLARAKEMAERVNAPPFVALQLLSVPAERVVIRGERFEIMGPVIEAFEAQQGSENRVAAAAVRAAAALFYAWAGRAEDGLRMLASVMPAIERGAGSTMVYTLVICWAAEALWALGCNESIEVIERNLREKTLAPDFRRPHVDARLSLARLLALQAQYDEAIEWFARARAVLDEQGARPLRARADLDEALMYVRRGAAGDAQRAAPLLEAAIEQFRAIGMPGWIQRAEELLRKSLPVMDSQEDRDHRAGSDQPTDQRSRPEDQKPGTRDPGPGTNLFRKEGDYWSIAFDGCAFRLKEAKGLHYLAYLLRHPGREFHALDLMIQACPERPRVSCVGGRVSGADNQRPETTDQGPLLDAKAKAAYRRRLDDLRDELTESEHNSDLGRAAKAREEMELIAEQLAGAVGLGGRDRPAGANAERARLAVTKGIKAALQKIRANHPELARHFAASIKTGYFCSYTPDVGRFISWVA
jgi:class 3 adenylate cyclase